MQDQKSHNKIGISETLDNKPHQNRPHMFFAAGSIVEFQHY